MTRSSRWHRFIRWVVERLYSWLPEECGALARTGDVYCTLPEDHDGPHGWATEGGTRT